MLKFPCLVLDHDDTVVQSEATINYPYFVYIMKQFRPGVTITLEEYTQGCNDYGFVDMCRKWYNFTDEELHEEYMGWKDYILSHIPNIYPGIDRIIRRQKEEGGLVCVVSHSSSQIITRDYRTHFGIEPDAIFSCDLPEALQKPSTYALEEIMKRFNLRKEELLVVDDMRPGWEMASKAGVRIAFSAWGRSHCPKIMEEMTSLCDYTFPAVENLENFLFV